MTTHSTDASATVTHASDAVRDRVDVPVKTPRLVSLVRELLRLVRDRSGRPSRAERLLAAARQAAQLRAYRTHPDVAALRIERVRAGVDALVWVGIILGLAFTMSNVAHFAAGNAPAWSLVWVIAWLLDPMVSLCLIGVLVATSTLARHQIKPGGWVRVARWLLLTATYAMNTWTAWASRDAALIVLHSVPPLVVFVMAEAITDLRDKLTDAVLAAHRFATAGLHHNHDDGNRWSQPGIDVAVTGGVPAADQTAMPSTPTPAEDHAVTPGPRATESLPGPAMERDHVAATETTGDTAADQTATTTNDRGPDTGQPKPQHGPQQGPAAATSGPDVSDLLGPGRLVRDRVAAAGKPLTRRMLMDGLRADGYGVSTNRASALLRALNDDTDDSRSYLPESHENRSQAASVASEAA